MKRHKIGIDRNQISIELLDFEYLTVRRTGRVKTEACLFFLTYNLKLAINILGTKKFWRQRELLLSFSCAFYAFLTCFTLGFYTA